MVFFPAIVALRHRVSARARRNDEEIFLGITAAVFLITL